MVLLGWNHIRASNIGPLLPPTLRTLTLRDDLWNWTRYGWNYDVLENCLEEYRTFKARGGNSLQGITLTDSSERPLMTDDEEERLVRLKLSFDNEGLVFEIATYDDRFTPRVEGYTIYFSDDGLST